MLLSSVSLRCAKHWFLSVPPSCMRWLHVECMECEVGGDSGIMD